MAARGVGAPSISGDEQLGLLGVQAFAMLVSSATDTLHRELRRVMVNAHVHKALVLHQIIDAIGHSLPISKREVIIHIDRRLFPFGLPLLPIVLKGPDQFFLLAIHRDDRIACCFKLLTLLLDMSKLGITVLMAPALNGFLVRAQRETHRVQSLADSGFTQLMPLARDGFL